MPVIIQICKIRSGVAYGQDGSALKGSIAISHQRVGEIGREVISAVKAVRGETTHQVDISVAIQIGGHEEPAIDDRGIGRASGKCPVALAKIRSNGSAIIDRKS